MTINVRLIDRLARFAIGLLLTGYTVPIGIVSLAAGTFSFCPLYSLIDPSTCSARRTE
jgi:Inner membrane protein YgaP-like, transmembrane domain